MRAFRYEMIQGMIQDSWDHVAPWYDSLAADQGSDYHRAVVIPGVLRLLAASRGESVLDVACGQGAVARALHDAGCAVVGVDLSRKLIDAARKRSPAGLRFVVGDARKLPDLGESAFDAAVCVLAMQNIDPVEPVFAEVARVLRPGGRLVAVVNHPAFRIPRQSRWKLDERRKLLAREVDGYLSPMKIPIDMRPFRRPGRSVTYTHHRPLQAYVRAATGSGLVIDALEEWPSHRSSQPGPMARAENRARAEIPLFLAIRAVRPRTALPTG
jgi:ubiquinone/menaquinone biosynthesis C-methylase UbiE